MTGHKALSNLIYNKEIKTQKKESVHKADMKKQLCHE